MNFFAKLERKLGKYAVRNLMQYFSVLYIMGLIVFLVNPAIYFLHFSLDIGAVMKGEVWRLLTWLIYPPSSSLIWGGIMIVLYYNLGITLENIWGRFRFNAFMFMGIIFHIIAATVIYFTMDYSTWIITPHHLNLSIFLAFALTFPETEFRLYFILAVKAKFLAYFYIIIELYYFITGDASSRVAIFLCMLNFMVFYIMTGRLDRFRPSEIKRKHEFREQVRIRPQGATKHRCAVCGRTELDGDDLEFRYCSKCSGNYEYCQDHIYTHVHVEEGQGDNEVK